MSDILKVISLIRRPYQTDCVDFGRVDRIRTTVTGGLRNPANG
jgi:hypothetical protein